MTIAHFFAAAAFFDSWVLGGSPPERGYVRIISHHAISHHITPGGGGCKATAANTDVFHFSAAATHHADCSAE